MNDNVPSILLSFSPSVYCFLSLFLPRICFTHSISVSLSLSLYSFPSPSFNLCFSPSRYYFPSPSLSLSRSPSLALHRCFSLPPPPLVCLTPLHHFSICVGLQRHHDSVPPPHLRANALSRRRVCRGVTGVSPKALL